MNNQLVAVAHNVKLAKWNEIISERLESGLTVDEYCKEHNVTKNAYYYWLRKCRENALSECGNAFAELGANSFNSSSLSDSFDSQAVLEINGIRISVSDRTSRNLLAMIVEVSRNA